MTGENLRVKLGGGDWAVRSLRIKDAFNIGSAFYLEVAGTLIVGSGGVISGREGPVSISGGRLTSATGVVNIENRVNTGNYPHITSTIVDGQDHKVGLRIFRDTEKGRIRGVTLGGTESNTYTGDTDVIGKIALVLDKESKAIAVSGNLNVRNGAVLSLLRSEQIANKSRVLLQSKGGRASTIVFSEGRRETITETIGNLTVDGSGVITFHGEGRARVGKRSLFLDDLDITKGSSLLVRNWIYGSDFLLVRKTGKNIKNVLKSIHFEGRVDHTELVDYNKDYWQIAHTPEAATYGAVFAAAGLGVVLFRKRGLRLRAATRLP